MKKLFLFILFSTLLVAQTELLFYCGVTMKKPMIKISKIIEKKYHIKIKIITGASGDLYDSLSTSKKGDLYLPGCDSYINKHLNDGIIGYRKYIGYNQIAIFTQLNNPKHIKSLEDLSRNNLKVSIGNPETCSMGRESIKVLKRYGGISFLEEVEDNILLYSIDSTDFNLLLRNKKIDVGLNWRATAFFPKNRGKITIININEKYAPKKKLILTMLKFSKNKKLAKVFIDFSASKEGQKIMKEYGFHK